jgi:Holliday junction DNA helicase RuvA
MIAQIQGTVVEIFDRGIIIDTGAIGYMVYTPAVVPIGAQLILHTHLVIREDAHELYGFQINEEKLLFMSLISVSGVGPKTGLQMLTMYPLAELVRAIRNGDAKTISLVPGIGKKTATNIVTHLENKVMALMQKPDRKETASSSNLNLTPAQIDAIDALEALGFDAKEVRGLILKLPAEADAKTLIQTVLKK